MRSAVDTLLDESPDRAPSKPLRQFNATRKDYIYKPKFFTYLHPDNLEEALSKSLSKTQ